MNLRPLGKTGLEVSEVGYGAWGIGQSMWIGADDQESLRALERAIDLGLNFIDTALAYGDGHSEQLVGKTVRARSETVHVAIQDPAREQALARVGRRPRGGRVPGDHIRSSTETSLRNLGLETIDLQQFHVWHDDWLEQGDWLETVQALKQEGKIRHFGVSINDHAPDTALELVRSGNVDTVQVIYNVFDQSPEDELFPAVEEHGVGVLARVPFDEGGLTGSIGAGHGVPRGRLPRGLLRGRPQAAGGRPRAGDRRRPRHRAGRDRRDRAALRPLVRRRLDGDPGHALDPQRRAQLRGRRRARAAARAGREAARPPLGARLLPLTRAAILSAMREACG